MKNQKSELIQKYQKNQQDTGSTPVQIIILSQQIEKLTSHLKEHPQDFDSKRGLLKMVNLRRKLLDYLDKTDPQQHQKIVADLNLRTSRTRLQKNIKATSKKTILKTKKSKIKKTKRKTK